MAIVMLRWWVAVDGRFGPPTARLSRSLWAGEAPVHSHPAQLGEALEIADGFAAVAAADGAPGSEIDVLAHEAGRSVAEQNMHSADMLAAGGHIGPQHGEE